VWESSIANTDIVARTLREDTSKRRIVVMVTHNQDLAKRADKTEQALVFLSGFAYTIATLKSYS